MKWIEDKTHAFQRETSGNTRASELSCNWIKASFLFLFELLPDNACFVCDDDDDDDEEEEDEEQMKNSVSFTMG